MTALPPVRTAVLPVAGLGTRFLPATRAIPKELLPIVDRPVVHYALDEARQSGIERFLFVTARGKSVIEDHFDRNLMLEAHLRGAGKTGLWARSRDGIPEPGVISYVRQGNPGGLGHAVFAARHGVGAEPFVVLLPDDFILGRRPALAQLLEARQRNGPGLYVGVKEVEGTDTRRYGIVDPDGKPAADGVVAMRGMVEKPEPSEAPSRLAAVGRYILDPAIFGALAESPDPPDGELQLTDAIDRMARSGRCWAVPLPGERFDCGSKIGLLKANIVCALRDPELGPRLRAFLQDLKP